MASSDEGWIEDGSGRSRAELLETVRRRGERLRTRRRVGLAAVPVLAAVLLLPAALRGGSDARTTVAASSPTVTGAPPSVLVSPSTTADQSTTSMAPPTSVATSVRPATTTTTVRASAPVTTVSGNVPPPDPEPTSTVPPTTVPSNQPPGPTCNPPKMTASAHTDKPAYKAGEVVQATATWTNTSGATCWYRHGYWGNWVVDAAGRIVTPQSWPPFDHNEWRPFADGETMSRTWTWDLTVCSANNTTACSPATPGTYKIIFDYEPFAEPTVTLQVVAA